MQHLPPKQTKVTLVIQRPFVYHGDVLLGGEFSHALILNFSLELSGMKAGRTTSKSTKIAVITFLCGNSILDKLFDLTKSQNCVMTGYWSICRSVRAFVA